MVARLYTVELEPEARAWLESVPAERRIEGSTIAVDGDETEVSFTPHRTDAA
ncbi:hypothetical protein ACQHIV_15495 [Kribbella sp. GL6]|uniref:hypothetical protein n=1 Tax=Kribbella sp. GL6 TaxID=3419765 RepID=UPI003D01C5B3